MSDPRVMGYARVSSTGQNLDRQILALRKYVPEENIIVDKQSGKDLERPGYMALKGALGLRAGDVLYVKSLDRLSRNKRDIRNELQWFQDNRITLRILDLPSTLVEFGAGQEWIQEMVTNILIEVMSSIAEQERLTIHQRQREGIEAAHARGTKFGRPDKGYPPDWDLWYGQYPAGTITRRYVMQKLGIGKDRFTYLVKRYKREHAAKG